MSDAEPQRSVLLPVASAKTGCDSGGAEGGRVQWPDAARWLLQEAGGAVREQKPSRFHDIQELVVVSVQELTSTRL